MNLNLDNKRVLITGASRGIGFAIAEGFLNEGAKVIIVARSQTNLSIAENLLKKKYGNKNINAYKCDCTKSNELTDLSDKILSKWGSIDIVVANVGDGKSVNDVVPNLDQWKLCWDKNFNSALYTSRIFIPILKNSKGTLLFISSIAGLEAFGAPTDYATAKTAVCSLAKNMAQKLGEDVRVNVIAPGNIFIKDGEWDKKIQSNAKHIEEIIDRVVPMKRFGKPEEVADAAVFLCSDRAKFITGSVLTVDGGQTLKVI
jgi:3-oxoacyl-[acyl-carrier protein] reductase